MNDSLHVTEDAIAGIEWRESIRERELTGEKLTTYTGKVNEFIVAVCTGYSETEYDAIAIRFRMRGLPLQWQHPTHEYQTKGIISVYRTGYRLEDLREGLWLSREEVRKINNAIDTVVDKLKINFIELK